MRASSFRLGSSRRTLLTSLSSSQDGSSSWRCALLSLLRPFPAPHELTLALARRWTWKVEGKPRSRRSLGQPHQGSEDEEPQEQDGQQVCRPREAEGNGEEPQGEVEGGGPDAKDADEDHNSVRLRAVACWILQSCLFVTTRHSESCRRAGLVKVEAQVTLGLLPLRHPLDSNDGCHASL